MRPCSYDKIKINVLKHIFIVTIHQAMILKRNMWKVDKNFKQKMNGKKYYHDNEEYKVRKNKMDNDRKKEKQRQRWH